jgi:hypothetical protein
MQQTKLAQSAKLSNTNAVIHSSMLHYNLALLLSFFGRS